MRSFSQGWWRRSTPGLSEMLAETVWCCTALSSLGQDRVWYWDIDPGGHPTMLLLKRWSFFFFLNLKNSKTWSHWVVIVSFIGRSPDWQLTRVRCPPHFPVVLHDGWPRKPQNLDNCLSSCTEQWAPAKYKTLSRCAHSDLKASLSL